MIKTPRHFPLPALAAFLIWSMGSPMLSAADAVAKAYVEPAVLTGTIYASVAEPKDILFTFRRTMVQSNSTSRVLREFNRPDGSLAAKEQVVYEAGKLVLYQLDEVEHGATGSAVIQPDAKDPQERSIAFEYTQDEKKKTGSEKIEGEAVINDMVGPFIQSHWDPLMTGDAVKFRFISIPRLETVGFKLEKESESTYLGKPVVLVKMAATSLIIAQFVEPLIFTVEKESPHRVLQYSGRTTPSIRKGNKWEDLDALTVFDWK